MCFGNYLVGNVAVNVILHRPDGDRSGFGPLATHLIDAAAGLIPLGAVRQPPVEDSAISWADWWDEENVQIVADAFGVPGLGTAGYDFGAFTGDLRRRSGFHLASYSYGYGTRDAVENRGVGASRWRVGGDRPGGACRCCAHRDRPCPPRCDSELGWFAGAVLLCRGDGGVHHRLQERRDCSRRFRAQDRCGDEPLVATGRARGTRGVQRAPDIIAGPGSLHPAARDPKARRWDVGVVCSTFRKWCRMTEAVPNPVRRAICSSPSSVCSSSCCARRMRWRCTAGDVALGGARIARGMAVFADDEPMLDIRGRGVVFVATVGR